MSISDLAMAAKKVIDATYRNGPAYDLASQAAFALESAQMLQSPETAAEYEKARETARQAVRVAEESLAELKWEHAENAKLRKRIAELEQGPALPWAHAMSDDDLHGFLGDLVSAALGRWQHSPEVPDREVLATVEKACADWRTPGQGYRSDEPEQPADALTRLLAPTQALREPAPGACTKCEDGPDDWCVGCSACKCQTHQPGCMYAVAP